MIMPFGKYKGTEVYALENEDPGYIVWLHDNVELFDELYLCVLDMYPRCKKKYKPKKRLRFVERWEEGKPDMFGVTREWNWDATDEDYADPDYDGYTYYGIPNMD